MWITGSSPPSIGKKQIPTSIPASCTWISPTWASPKVEVVQEQDGQRVLNYALHNILSAKLADEGDGWRVKVGFYADQACTQPLTVTGSPYLQTETLEDGTEQNIIVIEDPASLQLIDAGGFTDRAIFGELMATYCKSRGIMGIVCDGAIRDRGGLAAMEDFHVYARSATPNGPYKNGPGEINVPVVIGGKIVHPGDIVVGDDDGVLFIDPTIAAELADATEAVEKKEADIMAHILGDGTYIRPWVDEKLKEIGCEIL